MGDEVLDQLVLGSISFANLPDGDFVLDDSYECCVEFQMGYLEGIFMRLKRLIDRKLDLGSVPAVYLLEMLQGL